MESRHVDFEQILDRLPHGVLVVNRDLVVAFVNPEATRLLGEEVELEAGRPLPDTSSELSLRRLAETLITAEQYQGGHLITNGDRTLCIKGLPTDGESAILTIDDVSDRERLRRAERHFVENAAHELRTPLAAIVSVVEALESGAKETPAVRDRFLQHLLAHSERLRRLASSLLVLARVQTGQQTPKIELLEVEPLLEQVAADLDAAPGVEIRVSSADGVRAIADRDLLYHALLNVAGNAAKYTSEGEIALAAHSRADRVEIEVRDTGLGMTRANSQHAFDRFYRGDEAGRDGFGLGLAIAEEAIEALGGSVTLASTVGVGTRVRIDLPSGTVIR